MVSEFRFQPKMNRSNYLLNEKTKNRIEERRNALIPNNLSLLDVQFSIVIFFRFYSFSLFLLLLIIIVVVVVVVDVVLVGCFSLSVSLSPADNHGDGESFTRRQVDWCMCVGRHRCDVDAFGNGDLAT